MVVLEHQLVLKLLHEGKGGQGGDSYFIDTSTVKGGGAGGVTTGGSGGNFVGDNQNVGNGHHNIMDVMNGYGSQTLGSGGSGAAGYSGDWCWRW